MTILRVRQKQEIQSGGFGHGYIDVRLDTTDKFLTRVQVGGDTSKDLSSIEDGAQENIEMIEAKFYTDKIITTPKVMVALLLQLKDTPAHIRQ